MPAPTLIAVDLDDVLCQTNHSVAEWHNENHGTSLTLQDFHYYHYWKNPGWGTPKETFEKVSAYYASNAMDKAIPVPGAREALERLREEGFRFAVVTARTEAQRAMSAKWLGKHYPDLFDELHFTGSFQHLSDPIKIEEGKKDDKELAAAPPKVTAKPMSKAEVITTIGASHLIDDSIENALTCASHTPSIPALLLSPYDPTDKHPTPHYPWNVAASRQETEEDMLSYAERKARGLETGESRTPEPLPEGIQRVRGWDDVVDVLLRTLD